MGCSIGCKETHNISNPNLAFWSNCADPKVALGAIDLNREVVMTSVIAYLENISPLVVIVRDCECLVVTVITWKGKTSAVSCQCISLKTWLMSLLFSIDLMPKKNLPYCTCFETHVDTFNLNVNHLYFGMMFYWDIPAISVAEGIRPTSFRRK